MLQIPITGAYAIFSALHASAGAALLFAIQDAVAYQPYLSIYFN